MSYIEEFFKRLDDLTGDESLDELLSCIDLAEDCHKEFCHGKDMENAGADEFWPYLDNELGNHELNAVHSEKMRILGPLTEILPDKQKSVVWFQIYTITTLPPVLPESRAQSNEFKLTSKAADMFLTEGVLRSTDLNEEEIQAIETFKARIKIDEKIKLIEARKNIQALKENIDKLKAHAIQFDEKNNEEKLTPIVERLEKQIDEYLNIEVKTPEDAKQFQAKCLNHLVKINKVVWPSPTPISILGDEFKDVEVVINQRDVNPVRNKIITSLHKISACIDKLATCLNHVVHTALHRFFDNTESSRKRKPIEESEEQNNIPLKRLSTKS